MPELIIILAVVLSPILIIPFVTAHYAKGTGRDFKLWLLLGLIFPVISLVILIFLPEKTQNNVKEIS